MNCLYGHRHSLGENLTAGWLGFEQWCQGFKVAARVLKGRRKVYTDQDRVLMKGYFNFRTKIMLEYPSWLNCGDSLGD